jgi:hypothetical protein
MLDRYENDERHAIMTVALLSAFAVLAVFMIAYSVMRA